MPGLDEVRLYLGGLWLLIRGDASGFKLLDISDRGVSRSFWAILWAFPAIAVSWFWWRILYVRAIPGSDGVDAIFFLRLAMLELANWLVPLVLIGILSWLLGLGRRFLPMVVTVNWLSVPFAYAYGLLSLLLMLLPSLTGLLSFLWLGLMIAMVVVISRVFRMICGPQPLMIATLTMVLIVPTMLLSEALERFLGIYPG